MKDDHRCFVVKNFADHRREFLGVFDECLSPEPRRSFVQRLVKVRLRMTVLLRVDAQERPLVPRHFMVRAPTDCIIEKGRRRLALPFCNAAARQANEHVRAGGMESMRELERVSRPGDVARFERIHARGEQRAPGESLAHGHHRHAGVDARPLRRVSG